LRYRKKYFECYAAKEAVELGIAFWCHEMQLEKCTCTHSFFHRKLNPFIDTLLLWCVFSLHLCCKELGLLWKILKLLKPKNQLPRKHNQILLYVNTNSLRECKYNCSVGTRLCKIEIATDSKPEGRVIICIVIEFTCQIVGPII
jgi:hypothetical protein